ncbi:SusC/RagA family TonB-linked outer membrane protein [Microbacter margulisiae]|uniref:Iron complex outermembrane receptor protein n=1 Tax=Microbacter margulisiae TaxID=1350067 RepID=A0A7W5DRC5_9PORP|nr:SusC/RagA family TonB-linked outer membrane protein [Microbacter margulisiae]MBB3187616.1 iron complex outermembrane receptor protein [Microbacter margulisiae]
MRHFSEYFFVFVMLFLVSVHYTDGQSLMVNDSISNTGMVYRVDAKDSPKGVNISPEELIQGQIPGLQITSNSGSPESDFTIINRGIGSLSTSTSPLVIVDGMFQYDNMISLNPEDIESIVMVKDASALQCFGDMAANGALIITTKKGSATFHIRYSGNVSVSEIAKKAGVLSASAFRTLLSQQYAGNKDVIGLMGNASTDWQNEIYQTAVGQDHHLSLSGTYKGLPYRVSLGQTNQEGILKTDNYRRTTTTLSLTPSLLDNTLKIHLNVNASFNNNTIANTNAIGSAIAFDPTQPVMNGSKYGGYFTWMSYGAPLMAATKNPVALLNQVHQTDKTTRIEGNLGADYALPFLPGLHIEGNYAYGYFRENYQETNDSDAAWYQTYAPTGTDHITQRNRQFNLQLGYSKSLEAIDGKLNVFFGYSHMSYRSTNDSYYTIYPASTSPNANFSQQIDESHFTSFTGGVDFTLKDTYSLSAHVQKHLDSQFPTHSKSDWMSSGSLAWNMKHESFLQHADWLSDLQLRLSYSNTWSLNPLNASALYDFVVSNSTSGGLVRPYNFDPNVNPETVLTYDAGVGFGMLNQRITGGVNVYQRTTNNIILYVPISGGYGSTTYLYANDGKLTNKGIELHLGIKPIVSKQMTWTLNYSFSYNQNRRTDAKYSSAGLLYGAIYGGTGNYILIIKNNFPVGSFDAYQQIYDANHKPIEGDYATNDNPMGFHIEHQIYPTILMGLSSNFTYKKWFLNCSLHANIGNYVYNNIDASGGNLSILYNSSGFLENASRNVLVTHFRTYQPYSDYYIQNASFVSMDNISAGYTFDKLLDTKLGATLYVAVQNAFVITGYKGQDPEQATGIEQASYPRARTFVVGLSVDL